jgi:HPt (histidine-containing phosphotransfer) domain-containing protein
VTGGSGDDEVGRDLGPVYDRALALSRVGNNPAIADELLALMLAELPSQREELVSAFSAREHAGLRRLAHRLRGSAGCCGMPRLEHACHAVEMAVDARAEADLPLLVAVLVEQVDAVLALKC